MISSVQSFISNRSTLAILKSYLWEFRFYLAVITAFLCNSGGSKWNPPIYLIIFSLNAFLTCTNNSISRPKSLLLSDWPRATQCCKSIVPHTCRSYVAAAWPLSDSKFIAAIPFPAVFSYFSTFFMLLSPPIEDKYLAMALCSSLNLTLKIDAASHVTSIKTS